MLTNFGLNYEYLFAAKRPTVSVTGGADGQDPLILSRQTWQIALRNFGA